MGSPASMALSNCVTSDMGTKISNEAAESEQSIRHGMALLRVLLLFGGSIDTETAFLAVGLPPRRKDAGFTMFRSSSDGRFSPCLIHRQSLYPCARILKTGLPD